MPPEGALGAALAGAALAGAAFLAKKDGFLAGGAFLAGAGAAFFLAPPPKRENLAGAVVFSLLLELMPTLVVV